MSWLIYSYFCECVELFQECVSGNVLEIVKAADGDNLDQNLNQVSYTKVQKRQKCEVIN